MKQVSDEISKNLKKIRERRNLSFDQLSQFTGVSKSMLRQIETGKSNPTVSTIWKIANGLHLSFSYLLQKPAARGEVKAFTFEKPLYAETRHYRVFPLVSFDPRRAFEVYFFEMDGSTVFEAEQHQGGVQEYIFLYTGGIEVRIEEQKFSVSAGQFMEFKADLPHIYRSAVGEVSSGIMILSYGDY